MALKFRSGNRPLVDEHGFVHAVLKSVELFTQKEKSNGGEWSSLRWVFQAQGTVDLFEYSELTGLSIHPPDQKGELNKATSIAVRLGILTMEDIAQVELPDHDLQSAVGQCVQFKIYPKDGFSRIDLTTLCLDETPKPTRKPKA